MLDVLREYLVKLPTPTTAPLYLQVNTPEMLAALSTTDAVVEVKCYSNSVDPGPLPTCYVVVRELVSFTSRFGADAYYQGGSRQEALGLEIEVNSSGASDTAAENRAELLRMEIDIFLRNNRALVLNGTNSLVRTPVNPGETRDYDKIVNFFPVKTQQKNTTPGSSLKPSNTDHPAKRFVQCEVWVYRGR
jgi:hypothetical protein